MTHEEIAAMVGEIGLPFAYYQFPNDTPQAPPFVCFIYGASDDLYADDSNYQHITPVQVELYTVVKDFELEQATEDVLAAHGITWEKDEGFLDSEKMHMTTYQFEVVITPEGDINNG